ncbi:MAG: hypothetical protein R3357_02065 [Burkholderiales bacterium]|nr:hypothetical protein [Burkholderiales bacterium]
MAAWLIPALKAVLPHVGTIVSAATPVFTKRADPTAANQALLLQQQITELQAAASQNAAHVRDLAGQLQTTVAALEQGATLAEARLRRALAFCAAAIGVSAIALVVALLAYLGR